MAKVTTANTIRIRRERNMMPSCTRQTTQNLNGKQARKNQRDASRTLDSVLPEDLRRLHETWIGDSYQIDGCPHAAMLRFSAARSISACPPVLFGDSQ